MALYTIGDLHLSFSVDKPMDRFGSVWKDHTKKIEKYWNKRLLLRRKRYDRACTIVFLSVPKTPRHTPHLSR